jgi:hypothetical protein
MRAVHLIRIVFAFCGLVALISSASAQMVAVPHTAGALMLCDGYKSYAPHDNGAPGIIARSLVGPGAILTFRTCRDADGNTHYFVRKPRPNRSGLCRVFEDELFPGRDRDAVSIDVQYDGTAPDRSFELRGWTERPPQKWRAMYYEARHESFGLATSASAACPRSDDARYIPVSGTDGTITSFFKIWRAATLSREGFDRAFGNVPVLAGMPGEAAPSQSEISGALGMLRSAVFDQHLDIFYVDCQTSQLSTLSGCVAGIYYSSILFDVTDHGLVINGIRENPAI